MKKFALYIVTIFIVVLGFFFLMDWIYTYSYYNGTPRNKVSYLISNENKKIDYVFLGSSRVDNGINTNIIESVTGKKSINLGVQGAKLDDIYFLLKLLQERNIKSEVIFIQVDYIYNIDNENSEILKSSLMPFIKEELVADFLKERDDDFLFLKNFPFYRYLKYDYKIGFREFLNVSAGNKPGIDLENGFSPKYGNSGAPLEGSLPGFVNQSNKSINAIEAFAVENNIKIIYFMAPYCSGTKNLEFSSKLKNKISSFLDFSQVFLKNDNYFYDCGHLNNVGATEFSKIFASKINQVY